jgi:hypothetical protein
MPPRVSKRKAATPAQGEPAAGPAAPDGTPPTKRVTRNSASSAGDAWIASNAVAAPGTGTKSAIASAPDHIAIEDHDGDQISLFDPQLFQDADPDADSEEPQSQPLPQPKAPVQPGSPNIVRQMGATRSIARSPLLYLDVIV